MSLRKRLLWFSLTQISMVGLVFCGALLLVHATVTPMLHALLRDRTTTTAQQLVAQLDVAVAAADNALLEQTTLPLRQTSYFLALRIADAEDKPMFESGNVAAELAREILATDDKVRETKQAMITSQDISLEGLKLGSVTVVLSTARLHLFERLMQAIGLIGLLALGFATRFSYSFSASFVAPLQRMVQFARAIAKGKYDKRVQIQAEGEIRQLGDDLNVMAQELGAREDALKERQAELADSLERLKKTREELMQSTRLASVGEMAGRTAHEVLNPVMCMQGRVDKLAHEARAIAQENLRTFGAIVQGWREPYQAGGADALFASLQKTPQVEHEAAPRTLLDEDLESLDLLYTYLEQTNETFLDGCTFIQRELSRVEHIVDNMRGLARHQGTTKSVPLLGMLEETVDMLADGLAKHDVQAKVSCDPDWLVHLDRYEFIQILTNLARNAIRAIKHAKRHGVLSFIVHRHDGMLHLEISDTGVGIPEDHRDLIFEPNFTSQSSEEGTGLGLSIARRLARGVGGELTLKHTEVGVGTTFELVLPPAEADIAAQDDTEQSALAATTAGSAGNQNTDDHQNEDIESSTGSAQEREVS